MKAYLFLAFCFIGLMSFAQKNSQDINITGDTIIKITDTIVRPIEIRIVKGQIKDAKTGTGISGAIVRIKGSTVSTVTNLDGYFNLNINKGDKLIISITGFASTEIDPNITNTGTSRGPFKIETQQTLFHNQKTEVQTSTMKIFPVPYPNPSSIYSFPSNVFSSIQFLHQADSILKQGLDHCGYDEKRYYYIPHGFALVTQMEQINVNGSSRMPPDRWSSKIAVDINNPWDYIKALISTATGYYRVLVFLISDIDHSVGNNYISETEARKWLGSGYITLPTDIRNIRFTKNYNCTLLIYHYKKQQGEKAQQVFPDPLTGKTHFVRSRLSEFIK